MGLHQRGILPRCVSAIGSSGCRGFCRVLDPFSGGFAGQGIASEGTAPYDPFDKAVSKNVFLLFLVVFCLRGPENCNCNLGVSFKPQNGGGVPSK